MSFRILVGDCRDSLKSLADQSVQCCVTSPPYYGLRDYGHAAQLGLEKTPAEYVEKMVQVFREVRRVLRDDGTLWLNIGDSYAGSGKGAWNVSDDVKDAAGVKETYRPKVNPIGQSARVNAKTKGAGEDRCYGLKPKDLIGIPWALAKALRDPYYTGSIKDERDRIWLAAMLDAEGCLFIHKRKEGQHNGQGYHRKNANYGPGVEISNTSLALVERIASLVGKGSICSQGPNENHRRKQTIYRWNLRTTESRDFVRELYPYLVAKKQQARILYGCPSSGERAEAAHAALISLHRTGESTVDFPAPPPMFEPGFYLRSDIIWNKSNPMPESVTDRPTKSHEYLFLLSKSERYYYDALAIAESVTDSTVERLSQNVEAQQGYSRVPGKTNGTMRAVGKLSAHMKGTPRNDGERWRTVDGGVAARGSRNKRSVWTVTTQPFREAHFATFPPKLIEPCILAGSARQACEHCGKAWERIVERGEVTEHPARLNRANDAMQFHQEDNGYGEGGSLGRMRESKTLGFAPSCDCGSTNPVPSTVLDPFGGAGTTGLVADRLGRDSILCELNEQYAEMARKRITDDAPLFAERLGA